MKIFRWNIIWLLLVVLGCTHTYEPEVKNSWDVGVQLSFVDPEYWPEGQQVFVGLFSPENDKIPVANVSVKEPLDINPLLVRLDKVEEGRYTAKLYLTENGIYKVSIADLGTYEVYNNIIKEMNAIQLITFDRVQRQVLNRCVVCHGASSGDIAAELNLTAGNSYESLVDVKAHNKPELFLVYPGSSHYSFLLNVLNEDIDFNHAASSSATKADRQLVIDWIDQGALNN